MSKKKGPKYSLGRDFTINDSANAPKPVNRTKKAITGPETQEILSWDQIENPDLDLIEEYNEDGTKTLVYKKKRNRTKSGISLDIDERPGRVYPEIVWYLISQYIKPEYIGTFALINKAAYAATKRESFWRNIYKRYCDKNKKLPFRLKLENSYISYGLRQRVIRALYYTYQVFLERIIKNASQDSQPHKLVKRRCVNVWFSKSPAYWSVFFKLKRVSMVRSLDPKSDFIDELGRVDANPEEDSQVLQITCQSIHQVPPLMGYTLSSVSVVLAQGFRHHKLQLGFNSGAHNVNKDILPECLVVFDTVIKILVFDWWHPNYPHFDNSLPKNICDDEQQPMLKENFFEMKDRDF